MEEILIGFGSNQGDSVRICTAAVEILRRHPYIEVRKVSSLYRTAPVGMTEQDWFINGVAQGETSLTPEGLLDELHSIENDFGRIREMRWGPRTLDLDILSFGERRIDSPGLAIPHPRLHERLFVLVPLAEVAPRWIHPGLNLSAHTLLDRISGQGNVQRVERLEEK